MILKELPIGARVLEQNSGLVFAVAGKRGYACEAIPMLSERIVTVGSFDAAEPLHEGTRVWDEFAQYGWNNYEKSNIHQWLNSREDNWYKPSHKYDDAPTTERIRYHEQSLLEQPGFLCRFSETFQNALLEDQIPVLIRLEKNVGYMKSISAKVYLPSRTEMVKGNESGYEEGKPFPLCYDPGQVNMIRPTDEDMEKYGRQWNPAHEGAPLDAPQIYDPKFAWWYYLRTPNLQYGFLVRNICAYGSVSYTYANNDIVGIRPVCSLKPDTEIELNHSMRVTENGVEVRLYQIKNTMG